MLSKTTDKDVESFMELYSIDFKSDMLANDKIRIADMATEEKVYGFRRFVDEPVCLRSRKLLHEAYFSLNFY